MANISSPTPGGKRSDPNRPQLTFHLPRDPFAALMQLRLIKRSAEAHINSIRAGFISGELPLENEDYEVVITERMTLDLERLREFLGEEFLERFKTKPVRYVLVRKKDSDIEDED